jgi:hypothetical protein
MKQYANIASALSCLALIAQLNLKENLNLDHTPDITWYNSYRQMRLSIPIEMAISA